MAFPSTVSYGDFEESYEFDDWGFPEKFTDKTGTTQLQKDDFGNLKSYYLPGWRCHPLCSYRKWKNLFHPMAARKPFFKIHPRFIW